MTKNRLAILCTLFMLALVAYCLWACYGDPCYGQQASDHETLDRCALAEKFALAAATSPHEIRLGQFKSYSDFGFAEADRFIALSKMKPEQRDASGYFPSDYENGHDGKLKTGPAKEWWHN